MDFTTTLMREKVVQAGIDHYKRGYDEGSADSLKRGEKKGYDIGYNDGEEEGYERGYNDGFVIGVYTGMLIGGISMMLGACAMAVSSRGRFWRV